MGQPITAAMRRYRYAMSCRYDYGIMEICNNYSAARPNINHTHGVARAANPSARDATADTGYESMQSNNSHPERSYEHLNCMVVTNENDS